MPIVIDAGAASTYKPCFAPSENVGLCLRSNGEQSVLVIDPFGYSCQAGIPAPVAVPTVVASARNGSQTIGQWVCYAYCYGASSRFPYVEADSIGGLLYPRSNPSPASAAFVIQNTGAADVTVTYDIPGASYSGTTGWPVDTIWLGRTQYFDDEADALAAAAAGDFYFLDIIAVPSGTVQGTTFTYTDELTAPTDDLLEYDNYQCPQFQFCIYVDPYWWGFGNYLRKVAATWDANGLVTFLDDTFTFYDGRFSQPCYLAPTDPDVNSVQAENVLFYATAIYQGSLGTCQLIGDLNNPSVKPTISAGQGYIVFAGPSTTLYRSKYRNPMAWGYTDYVGDIRVPSQWYLKVGGGMGTGIAQVPNTPLLIVSTKGPSRTYALDLRLAGSDSFDGTLKCISTLYGVTSHFSQFAAVGPGGAMALWGWDGENYVITACDGNSIVPISAAVSVTLRNMSVDWQVQALAHGLYDPTTQLNCLWLPSSTAATPDTCIMQYAPTGRWYTQYEGDVLSSGIVEGNFCALRKIYGGSSFGHFGVILSTAKTRNWVYEQFNCAGVLSMDEATQTLTFNQDYYANMPGLPGLMMLVCSSAGDPDQYAQLLTVNGKDFTTGMVYTVGVGWSETWSRIPDGGNAYYIGVIEASLLRYFDMSKFAEDKKLDELYLSMAGCDAANPTLMQYFRDRSTTPLGLPTGGDVIEFQQVAYMDGSESQQWMCETPPTEPAKVCGLRLVDRGYTNWQLFGIAGKFM